MYLPDIKISNEYIHHYGNKIPEIAFGDYYAIALYGCSWRCAYCVNKKQQIKRESDSSVNVADLINRIKEKEHLIDGIIISGGEPTENKGIIKLLKILKKEFSALIIILQTNGAQPAVVEKILSNKLIDSLHISYKTSIDDRLIELSGGEAILQDIIKTFKIAANSKVKLLFNTPMYMPYTNVNDICKMSSFFRNENINRGNWFLSVCENYEYKWEDDYPITNDKMKDIKSAAISNLPQGIGFYTDGAFTHGETTIKKKGAEAPNI